ncbi:MAG: GYDIA family GHMP kinase [Flavobacterium sp.]|nr:GYDIA family GHMP kinase [Flavobacterium sp.]
MKKTFYSNGKLLITSEYVVLDGAKALALPTKKGQNLVVEDGNDKQITWKSYDSDGSVWFEDIILFSEITTTPNLEIAPSVKNTLVRILYEAFQLNPMCIDSDGYKIETHLTFPRLWGLGTSSTLINNIAQWLKIDAYVLLKNSFGGSGYDIACAQNPTPIRYHLENNLPKIETILFNPDFKNKIWFVYLNEKQSSKSAIAAYKSKGNSGKIIPQFDALTAMILHSENKETFTTALEKHEVLMGNLLEMQPIKERLFHDFEGTLKSLGAWGGDFIMAVAANDPTGYFKRKGYETVIPYEEMILGEAF